MENVTNESLLLTTSTFLKSKQRSIQAGKQDLPTRKENEENPGL